MPVANLDFAVRYPFTNEAKELLKASGIKISERLAELAIERILAAINGVTKKTTAIHEGEKLEEIASFAAARMLLGYLRSSYVINKFAVAESKRASHYLSNADKEEFEKIANELGVIAQQKYGNIYAPLVVYLKFSPRSIDYRLVTRDLFNGQVKISRREWIRLTEEAVRFHIERIPVVKEVQPEIKNAAKKLLVRLPRVELPSYPIDKTSNAPCIEALLEDARQHKNLPHQARWYLAVYLIKKGASDDDLLRIFSMLPDYNEKITRYQITHARKQGYSVPSCASVLSYGLCRARCGIRNPLEWRGRTTENKPTENKKIEKKKEGE